MQRRDFYLLVAESGVDPLTLKTYLNGKRNPMPATVRVIEETAKRLGIDLTVRDNQLGKL